VPKKKNHKVEEKYACINSQLISCRVACAHTHTSDKVTTSLLAVTDGVLIISERYAETRHLLFFCPETW